MDRRSTEENGDHQGNNNNTTIHNPHWTTQQQQHETNPRRRTAVSQQSQSQPQSQQTHHQHPPLPPPPQQQPPCPRCSSTDTKFGYYNNYSLTQPRYFCKGCKRYWTHGGALRNVPVGGSSRKAKRPRLSSTENTSPPPPPPPPLREGSTRFDSVSHPQLITPGKVLEIGEGSALSLPITTAISVSAPSTNYLNPNYRQFTSVGEMNHGFFTSLIGFHGMTTAAASQPFFPMAADRGSGFESVSSSSSVMNNLGHPLFHFSPVPRPELPIWCQSFVTTGPDHLQVNPPPVASMDAMFRSRRQDDHDDDDGGRELKVKDDDASGSGGGHGCSNRGSTDQQSNTPEYGRDGN